MRYRKARASRENRTLFGKVRVGTATLLFIAIAPRAFGDAPLTEKELIRATNNAGFEVIECAAYFGVVAEGLRQTEGATFQETAKRYEQLRDEAMLYALAHAENIDQKPETVAARFEMSLKDMAKEMQLREC